MKKMVSLLLVVLFLTAACSNKTAATSSSTSDTSGTTDVAEADATNTGATDNADTDDSAESDAASETSTEDDAETPERNPSHNPDDYWVSSDEFKLKSYYWSFLPAVTEVGVGYLDATRTKKSYIFCKINDWEATVDTHGAIWLKYGRSTSYANALYSVPGSGSILVDDGLYINRGTLEIYLLVLSNIAENPDMCPFSNTGIEHVYTKEYECPNP